MHHSTSSHRDPSRSWKIGFSIAAAICSMALLTKGCIAQVPPIDPNLNEEIVMIPVEPNAPSRIYKTGKSSGGDTDAVSVAVNKHFKQVGNSAINELETTIYKPPGEGPFPVLVLNHGKSLGNPRNQERARFMTISREFVKRGYAVVVPMRSGFSKSTGDYIEQHCNMTANGQIQANDLEGVLEHTMAQPWADKSRILVAGQSYGGLTSIAFGTRDFPGVKGIINFAGGLRTTGCEWQASLVQAFSLYGGQSQVPSIWFYGENDSFFNHDLAHKMHDAYTRAGGNATLVTFGPFKNDAHGMSGSRDGVQIWWPETEKFLRHIGMPTEEIYAVADPVQLPKSDYAELDNIDAIPFLKERGREQYRTFLTKSMPRAFALSPSGAWSWTEDGDDPAERALNNCQKNSSAPCQLYAVDDYVVWTDKSEKS